MICRRLDGRAGRCVGGYRLLVNVAFGILVDESVEQYADTFVLGGAGAENRFDAEAFEVS